jgi:hypothetical protein
MTILFSLTNSQFRENTSLKQASFIYIDSIIINSYFTSNISEKKANILIHHRSRVITFDKVTNLSRV